MFLQGASGLVHLCLWCHPPHSTFVRRTVAPKCNSTQENKNVLSVLLRDSCSLKYPYINLCPYPREESLTFIFWTHSGYFVLSDSDGTHSASSANNSTFMNKIKPFQILSNNILVNIFTKLSSRYKQVLDNSELRKPVK